MIIYSIWLQVCCPSTKVTPPGRKGIKFCDTEEEINAIKEYDYGYDYNDDGIIEDNPGCEAPPDNGYVIKSDETRLEILSRP